MSEKMHARRAFAVLVGSLLAALPFLLSPLARAEATDGGARDAEAEAEAPEDPATVDLHRITQGVRDLSADQLPASTEAQTLFDIPLADDGAVDLEVVRLGALLREVDADAGKRAVKPVPWEAGVPLAVWQARLDLDRARLAFYSLPSARRHELVALHASRSQKTLTPSEAETKEKDAKERREKALVAARDARSETERVVKEEYARLLDVERAQAGFEKSIAQERKATADRRDATLVWQRKAREARTSGMAPDKVDALYDELRKALRAARDGLDAALSDIAADASGVPVSGPDPLAELDGAVDKASAVEERKRVDETTARLTAEERSEHEERASQLLDEVDSLNTERLALLSFLSSSKRSAITGFTTAGVDQASSEVRQLTLIARDHRYATANWLHSLRHPTKALGLTAGRAPRLVRVDRRDRRVLLEQEADPDPAGERSKTRPGE